MRRKRRLLSKTCCYKRYITAYPLLCLPHTKMVYIQSPRLPSTYTFKFMKKGVLVSKSTYYFLGKVIRIPFYEVQHFAHLDKEQLIKREWDVYLKRHVLQIQTAHTIIHMVHVFKNVPEGQYVIKLRLRLSDSKTAGIIHHRHHTNGPQTPACLSVSTVPWTEPYWTKDQLIQHEAFVKTDKKVQVVKQLFTGRDWLRIWQTQSCDYYAANMDNAKVIYDRDSDWFFLELKDFKIRDQCHLQVEFSAEQDYYWKRYMVWDFLELRQLCPR